MKPIALFLLLAGIMTFAVTGCLSPCTSSGSLASGNTPLFCAQSTADVGWTLNLPRDTP